MALEYREILNNKIPEPLRKETELMMRAYNLYIRYMRQGSAYEINIGYTDKKYIRNVLDNFDQWLNFRRLYGPGSSVKTHDNAYLSNELDKNDPDFMYKFMFKLFDKPKYEMYKLLLSAYQRFTQTPDYDRLNNFK